jgi:hypothetical protein
MLDDFGLPFWNNNLAFNVGTFVACLDAQGSKQGQGAALDPLEVPPRPARV